MADVEMHCSALPSRKDLLSDAGNVISRLPPSIRALGSVLAAESQGGTLLRAVPIQRLYKAGV